jgi:sulfopropanediol 3-dehydrogenase
MIAGPTDSLILADGTRRPARRGHRSRGQAEHGYNSPVWLVTDSRRPGRNRDEDGAALIADLPELNRENAAAAWRDYAEVIVCADREEMAATSDDTRPST